MTPDSGRQQTDNQRRFNRGSWIVVGLVVGFTALCAALSAFLLIQPGDGCQLDANADASPPIVACFGDWPTPLQPGDRVLAVNGWSTTDVDSLGRARRAAPLNLFAGDQASYTVLRDGASITRVVPIRSLGVAGVLRVFSVALTPKFGDWLLPVFLGALVVFLLAPRSGAARLLLISSSWLFIMMTFIWSAFTVPLSLAVAPVLALNLLFFLLLIWGWLFVPSTLLLVLSFPRRVWPLTRWPQLAPTCIYGLYVAASIFALVTGEIGPYTILLLGGALTVVVAGVAITLYTYLRERDQVLRAQTTWMTLGLIGGFAFWPLSGTTVNLLPGLQTAFERLPALAALFSFGVGLIFPVSMGIAILRYRLFDIEIIIRRTLLYAALTLTLGTTYFIGVVLLQALFVRLTGQESALAVVASTLAIAALFGPLRRRVQAIIDRRFFRRKYDARQVLEQFATRAQQQADLDALAGDILQVVQETVQPEQAHIWLIPSKEQRP